jgi:hypothetical protein
MNEMTPNIGHNSAAVGLPDVEAFIEQALAEHAEVRDRLLDLRVGLDKLPDTVTDDNAPLITDFIAQCQAAAKDWEKARKAVKGPIDDLGKAVQAAFVTRAAPITDKGKVLDQAKARLAKYHAELEARERAKREAEEKAAREAAEKARAEAQAAEEAARKAAQESEDREAAIRAQEAKDAADLAAQKAEKEAAKAEKATKAGVQVRGEYGGSTGYARRTWKFEVTDMAKLPLSFLIPDEKAIREWLTAETKGGNQPPEVPGLRCYQETSYSVKGA